MKWLAGACAAMVVVLLFLTPIVAPGDPATQFRVDAPAAPSLAHPFGTDELGQDLWVRFVHGGRWSVGIGLTAALLALALAWLAGSVAGWFGGRVDSLLMWITELFLSVPWLYLLIAVRAALPATLPARTAAMAIILLIALLSWARPARLVRGAVLSERERGWVEAARGFGVPAAAIYRRHILPATLGLLVTQALILLPRFVLAEMTLAFTGAGAGDTEPSWGALVVPLKQAYLLREEWWLVLPLLAMLPLFAVFALLARRAGRRSPLCG